MTDPVTKQEIVYQKWDAWRQYPKVTQKMRQRFIQWIAYESAWISMIQSYRTVYFDVFALLLGFLGTHLLYLTVFPVLFFNSNEYLRMYLRGVTVLLFSLAYLTGVVKDSFKLPRPFSPPVERLLEKKATALEYGLPSTHSAHASGVMLFTLLFWEQHLGSPVSLLVLTLSAFICGSRIYSGMHTFLDVSVGAMMGLSSAYIYWRYLMTQMENLLESQAPTHWPTIFIMTGTCLVIHPHPGMCPCYMDSISSLGAFAGVFMGSQMFHVGDLTKTTVDIMCYRTIYGKCDC
jgi:membrane-associated phospholipid phosphatase